MSQISTDCFMSKKKLNLFITSIESIYFSHCGRIATDNSPLFILLVQVLERRPLACISALLFVFSTRVDESTDWQSNSTLDDSTKPWPGLAVQLFTERGRKRKKERGSVCVCVWERQREREGKKWMREQMRERAIQMLNITYCNITNWKRSVSYYHPPSLVQALPNALI